MPISMGQVGDIHLQPDVAVTEIKTVTQSRNDIVNAVGRRFDAVNHSLTPYLSPPTVEVQPSYIGLPIISFPSSEDEMAPVVESTFVDCVQTIDEADEGYDRETTERKIEEFINMNPNEDRISQVEVDFVPLKCSKKKNPDYLVEPGLITSRNDCAVMFQIKGGKPGQEVYTTLQHSDLMLKKLPVKACKKHKCEDSKNFPPEFSFFIPNKKSEYLLIDDHPTSKMTLSEHNSELPVSFLCLNSCHKNQGRLLDLVLKLFDPSSKSVVSERSFSLRVCKNVKRDHKELKRLADDTVEMAPAMKYPKKEMEEEVTSLHDNQSLPNPVTSQVPEMGMSTPSDYYLIKLSKEQHEALVPLLGYMKVDELLKVNSFSTLSPPVHQ